MFRYRFSLYAIHNMKYLYCICIMYILQGCIKLVGKGKGKGNSLRKGKTGKGVWKGEMIKSKS